MTKRHQVIRERNLEEQIKDMFYNQHMPYRKIAEMLDLPLPAVQRFIREEKLKNYDESRLADVARSEDYNPLSLIDTFFESASFVASEMRFTAIMAIKFREEMANLMATEGMAMFHNESHTQTLNAWYSNTEKLTKLADKAPKQLEAYINLFTQVLDVQREVSYVKVITEILQQQDPATYKKIQKALQEDSAAKAVMGALDTKSIVAFWADSGTPAQAKYTLEEDSSES